MEDQKQRRRKKAKAMPTFSVEVQRQLRVVHAKAFTRWVEKCLRGFFSAEEHGLSLDDLIEHALALGIRVEIDKGQDLEKSQYPITYYMLQDPGGVVITGMMVTVEQLMEEVLKQRKTKKKVKTDGRNTSKAETTTANPSNG